MKLKIVLLLLIFSSKLIGQNRLEERNTLLGYKYYLDDVKVKKHKAIQTLLENDFLKADVNSYKKLNTTGDILGYSGAVLFGVGAGLIIPELIWNDVVPFAKVPITATEKTLLILGSVGVASGFYYKLKAHKQLKYCLNEFNNKKIKETTLKMGLTNNGNLGIVLNF